MQVVENTKEILDKALRYAEEAKTSKKHGQFGILVASVIVFAAVAFFYFEAWRKGNEHAKLQHEHDVALQKASIAEADAKLAEDQAKKEAALQEAARHQETMATLETKIQEVQLQHAEVLNKINQIKSWDDVDSFTGK
jgi:uncharacterized protein HemX